MLGDIALSIASGPASVILISVIACAAYAVWKLQQTRNSSGPDALADLFERDSFQAQMREAALLTGDARSKRRSVRDRKWGQTNARDQMLHQIAAVIRGAERDARIVIETTHYLAGEGFIIIADSPQKQPIDDGQDIIPIGEFEEVKLLPPPPAQAQAA